MSEQISKHTIAVLVILTVVISFLGTWTVMNEVNSIKVDDSIPQNSPSVEKQVIGSGQVTLAIVDPKTTKGKVTIDINE